MKLMQFRWNPTTFAMLASLFVCCAVQTAVGAATPTPAQDTSLSERLTPLFDIVAGRDSRFLLTLDLQVTIDGQPQAIQLSLTRYDDDAFDLEATHPDYALSIRRRADVTAFALPKHNVVYLGRGGVDAEDHLQPKSLLARVIGSGCQIAPYLPVIAGSDAKSTLSLAASLIKIERHENVWSVGDFLKIDLSDQDAAQWKIVSDAASGSIRVSEPGTMTSAVDWPNMRVEPIERQELEVSLSRGARRALEVLLPSTELTAPTEHPQRVAHGELRYVDGQRLVLLHGTPDQIGSAHGQLLPTESQRCIDSVLHAFGTVQTVVTGRWFRNDLLAAYQRLKSHIPEDHLVETRALALSLNQDQELMEALNVFPELFHCSGFAVSGSATVDGTLYHGRVLDYMTTIGLQDCATTFIISVDGKIPFANVGYAAFTGSVSGMNAESISLGEMGGRGEGQWDGVPMATLMRRALEECTTLAQVKQLWTDSPRTCEYYYVFADGKTNAAVGVAATPESIQFVDPGEGHALLGDGIPDAVVLSAGERLETLRARVMEHHGKIDAEKAMWLMSRPVAMESNLHNVLFVPADGVFFVANADHKRPAAERPYVRFDLGELLNMSSAAVQSE